MPPAQTPRATQKEPVGPIIGIIIIVLLMAIGAVYFWYARQTPRADTIPYIPGSNSTTTAA